MADYSNYVFSYKNNQDWSVLPHSQTTSLQSLPLVNLNSKEFCFLWNSEIELCSFRELSNEYTKWIWIIAFFTNLFYWLKCFFWCELVMNWNCKYWLLVIHDNILTSLFLQLRFSLHDLMLLCTWNVVLIGIVEISLPWMNNRLKFGKLVM